MRAVKATPKGISSFHQVFLFYTYLNFIAAGDSFLRVLVVYCETQDSVPIGKIESTKEAKPTKLSNKLSCCWLA